MAGKKKLTASVESNGSAADEKKVHHKAIIPINETDLAVLGRNACAAWAAHPEMPLVWLAQPQAQTLTTNYQLLVNATRRKKHLKPEDVKKLALLDAQANSAQAEVKVYIQAKYQKKNAASYYPQFGLAFLFKSWRFPFDRQKRSEAFSDIIAAIDKHGFNDMDFGKNFWTLLKTNYDIILALEDDIDKEVSAKVGNKKLMQAQVRKFLSALIHLIKANYPDTYKYVLREFGFQKEDY